MSQPDIKVFSARFCGYCTAAERLLKSKGLEYEIIKVDEDPENRKLMREMTGGAQSVPQIFIGDLHVGGFDDLSALNHSGQLDRILAKQSQ
jgi:glutaredoxin 3